VNSIQNTNKLIFDEISISRLVVYFIISKNSVLRSFSEEGLSLYSVNPIGIIFLLLGRQS
jgi:hypothetical protein